MKPTEAFLGENALQIFNVKTKRFIRELNSEMNLTVIVSNILEKFCYAIINNFLSYNFSITFLVYLIVNKD